MMTKSYNPSLDALRVISVLAVIAIHATSRSLEATHFDLLHALWTLFVNQISRFAVPLFFMISGFVLELNYKSNINYFSYLKKRLSRILVPYIFWSAIYYSLIYRVHSVGFLSSLLTGNSSYQLYFIPTLIIFYLFFPVLRILVTKWSIIFLGVVQFVLLYQDYNLHSLPVTYPVAIAMLNYFPFLLGIFVSRYQAELLKILSKFKLMLIPTIAYLGYFIYREGLTGYYASYNIHFFYSQWRPSILLYTISLGGLLYYLFTKLKLATSFIKMLSSLSFFVFFIHVFILETLWKSTGDHYLFALTTLISFTIAFLVHRIPNLSKLSG